MSEPIKIFLTDDHAVLRAGLKSLLNAEPDMQVVGETGGDKNCVEAIVSLNPDVTLLDLNMPCCNGLDVLVELRRQIPNSRVLVLTMHDDTGYLRQVSCSRKPPTPNC
jgi:two-component system response regulator NreC